MPTSPFSIDVIGQLEIRPAAKLALRAQALLAYLSLSPHPVFRKFLANNLLFEDHKDPMHNLRNTICDIRRLLPAAPLIIPDKLKLGLDYRAKLPPPGFGHKLLETMPAISEGFDAWLARARAEIGSIETGSLISPRRKSSREALAIARETRAMRGVNYG